jgi:hypothetical protein
MPFVQRDQGGEIIAVSRTRDSTCDEEVASTDPALGRFLASLRSPETELNASDLAFIRVLEDLIDLLVDRKIIELADLPEDAQKKLVHRKALRDKSALSALERR